MTRTPIGGRIRQPHPLNSARVISRKLLTLHCHGEFRTTVLLTQSLRPLSEFLAEPFSPGRCFYHGDKRFGVAKFQGHAARVFLGDSTRRIQVNSGSDGRAQRDRIEPLLIA